MDTKRQSLEKAIADMSAEAVSPEHMKRISGYLNNWNSTTLYGLLYIVKRCVTNLKGMQIWILRIIRLILHTQMICCNPDNFCL